MGERILLVNPITRRHKRRGSKATTSGRKTRGTKMARRRTAAQRRATAKLVAFNRARRRLNSRRTNPIRRRRRHARRRNPVSTAAAYRAMPAMTGYATNPRRRRRRRHHYAMNPRRRHYRRRRRNPLRLGRARGGMMGMVKAAFPAALGALTLDILFGYVSPYLPAGFVNGSIKAVTKSAGAIAMTWLAEKVVSKQTAQAMGVGALTVVFHDAIKSIIASTMPTLKMDGLGYYSAGYPAGGFSNSAGMPMQGMGVYIGQGGTPTSGLPMAGMGEYVSGMSRYDTERTYYG